MVLVYVAGESVALEQFTVQWLHEQIRRHGGVSDRLCVRVEIHESEVALNLITPGCSHGLGGGIPNTREAQVIDLWNQLHLGKMGWTVGNLNAFLKQLPRLIPGL